MNDREWLDENADPENGEFHIIALSSGYRVCQHHGLKAARKNFAIWRRENLAIAFWKAEESRWIIIDDDWCTPEEDPLERELFNLLHSACAYPKVPFPTRIFEEEALAFIEMVRRDEQNRIVDKIELIDAANYVAEDDCTHC